MFEAKTTTTDVIIPAHNHTLARFKYPVDARPKIQTVIAEVTYRPIIAWRCAGNGRVDPITFEPEFLGADGVWAIVCPTGLFVEPGIGSWKSSHDWFMEVLARWQARKPAAAA